jgi:hypothetical protein
MEILLDSAFRKVDINIGSLQEMGLLMLFSIFSLLCKSKMRLMRSHLLSLNLSVCVYQSLYSPVISQAYEITFLSLCVSSLISVSRLLRSPFYLSVYPP